MAEGANPRGACPRCPRGRLAAGGGQERTICPECGCVVTKRMRALVELDRLRRRTAAPDGAAKEAYRMCRRAAGGGGPAAGRPARDIAAAALYAACRGTAAPLGLKDVADAAGARRSGVARCWRLLSGRSGPRGGRGARRG